MLVSIFAITDLTPHCQKAWGIKRPGPIWFSSCKHIKSNLST